MALKIITREKLVKYIGALIRENKISEAKEKCNRFELNLGLDADKLFHDAQNESTEVSL